MIPVKPSETVPKIPMRASKTALRLLVLVVFFVQIRMGVSANQERYLYFTEIDGLPRNITTCLEQDQYGYVWIGTNNGIARFDGKSFRTYNELKKCGIISLLYDSKHNLWAGTHLGLYRYNPVTDFFELVMSGYISKMDEDQGSIYFLMVSNIYRINGSEIQHIDPVSDVSDFCFSGEGLWISKNNNGVFLYDRKDQFNTLKASFLQEMQVANLREVDGALFVGMFDGQLYVISEKEKIKKIDLENHYFYKAFKKVGNEVWIATDGNGIFILDSDFRFIKKIDRSQKTQVSINSNSIYDILTGADGEIWLASFGAGLTCILPDNQLFQNISPEKGNDQSLVANEGVSVCVREPWVYFGTNYGLSVWNKDANHFQNLSESRLRKELNGTKVTALYVDRDHSIWIGTYDGLLGHYTSDLRLIKTYHPCSPLPNEMQQIVDIKEIDENNLVILTQFHNQILISFDKLTGQTRVFELYYKGSGQTYCLLNSLRVNQQGELLGIITNLGLFHVNWKDHVIENRMPEMNSILQTSITDFYQDKNLNYWICSSTDGLIFVRPDGKGFRNWTGKDGLPSNTLTRMESTNDRHLWISTISGLCRFDTKTYETVNFNHRDGLPSNEFNERVSAIISDGRILFGSLAGFTLIDPLKANTDTRQPEVVISDISFQNQSLRNPKGKQYIDTPLEETREITLPYNKNSFSVHFFTKNKSFSQYHNYEYRLVGLEENWNYLGETSFATYTNLPPGTFVFEIKSADYNPLGIRTKLVINIRPPWYRAWYAYLAYIFLFFIILYLSIYAFLKRFELVKEKEVARIRIQKEHELTEKKLEFFTNVSHDLKTPLTLIDAPVSDLLESENLNPGQMEKLHLIRRNAQRLYNLISDLIDFRLVSRKQLKLEIREIDITRLIIDITCAFREECKNKSIDLVFHPDKNLTGFADSGKLEKILWNLLSNALKFTKEGGTITVDAIDRIFNGRRNLELNVSDTGIGIAEGDLTKIFDRFFKAHDATNGNREGTGIGLSIVKELVEMHHGTILVNSKPGEGTSFSIQIPIDKEAFTENELIPDQDPTKCKTLEKIEGKKETLKPRRYNLPKILFVEDHAELRDYLAGHFEKNFRVFTAPDGFAGLKTAKEINPDVIVTDVQMPLMNGYDFCKEIRSHFDTSHIPILMLTANTNIEQHLEGLATGADIYLTKPFEIRLLDAQIQSLLENRRKLRSKFHGIDISQNLEKTLPPKDVAFITEVKSFIEENAMKNDLNIEALSERFSVSVAQLHRKIKSLTGLTPNNLIKSIRLQIAYKLIKEQGLRISEAAYQTGFSDPNYFTTCFKKEFGINPSQV